MKKSRIISIMLSASLILFANNIFCKNNYEVNSKNVENISITNKNGNNDTEKNSSNLSLILNKTKIMNELKKTNQTNTNNNIQSKKIAFEELKKEILLIKSNTNIERLDCNDFK